MLTQGLNVMRVGSSLEEFPWKTRAFCRGYSPCSIKHVQRKYLSVASSEWIKRFIFSEDEHPGVVDQTWLNYSNMLKSVRLHQKSQQSTLWSCTSCLKSGLEEYLENSHSHKLIWFPLLAVIQKSSSHCVLKNYKYTGLKQKSLPGWVDADLGLVLTCWAGAVGQQGNISEREASIVIYISVKLLWKLAGFFL